METIRPIKTEADYERALERIDGLMDAQTGTPEGDVLDVLATLVDVYEDKHFPIDLPDPIEAIKFRMEQMDLKQAALVPYLGSRSKVSEVLSGKRPLTLQMIRALNKHFDIPAEVLLREPGASVPEDMEGIEWARFPVKQMAKLGWIDSNVRDRAEDLMRELYKRAGGVCDVPMFLRQSHGARHNAKAEPYALQAWCLYVLATARERSLSRRYEEGTITRGYMRRVAQLSVFDEGPRLAREHLSKHGIHLVYAPHLKRTYLDGAAMKLSDGTPVIGMTLRYDRLDNFWFCLMHELAHAARHLNQEDCFVDDLSLRRAGQDEVDVHEAEADEWAEEALIPRDAWATSQVEGRPTPANVVRLAAELEIHPAIVAGRVRFNSGNWRLLTGFVGQGEVRKHFERKHMN